MALVSVLLGCESLSITGVGVKVGAVVRVGSGDAVVKSRNAR